MPGPATPFDDQKPLRIRRGRVDSLDLYEIKDNELDTLEKGSPADLQLNFAIFLLSTAVSAICTLVSATFESSRVETVFILVAIVGLVGGVYLLAAWSRSRASVKELCIGIRNRIPPDVLPPTPSQAPSAGDLDPSG